MRVRWLALALALSALGGCGYRAGLAPNLGPDRPARTIGVEIFGNESLMPNTERELHAALSDAVRRHVSLDLVAPERADLVLTGTVEDFRRAPGARSTENRLVETAEVFVIEARVLDRARGEVLGSTRRQTVAGTPIDVPGREVATRSLALSNAADRLVLTLLAGLEYGVRRPAADD